MFQTAPSRHHARRTNARASRSVYQLVAGALVLSIAAPRPASAQTLEDAELLQPRELHATGMYSRDAWDQYWEGGLKRSNGNIGSVSTRSITVTGAYGVTNRLTVLASLPYVWTEASQGVL